MSNFWWQKSTRSNSRSLSRRRPRSVPSGRRLLFEALEPRLAPAVNATFIPLLGALTVTATQGDTIALTISGGNVKVNGSNPGLFAAPATSVRTVTIVGSGGNDTIDLSNLPPGSLPNVLTFGVNGGLGSDALLGPNAANRWFLTAGNQGNLNGTPVTEPLTGLTVFLGGTSFLGIERLVGGTQDDSFTLLASVAVTAAIDGGAGALSLGAAGDLSVTSVTGQGTITLEAPRVVLRPGGTIASGSAAAPGGAVRIESHSVTIDGSVATHGGALTVSAADIEVGANAPAMLSTRRVLAGASDATAPSVGSSGSITLAGRNIRLGTLLPGGGRIQASLLAHAGPGTSWDPGSVTIRAEQVAGTGAPTSVLAALLGADASIDLAAATIAGGDVSISATADHAMVVAGGLGLALPTIAVGGGLEITDALGVFSLVGALAQSSARAHINLSAHSTVTAGNVSTVAFARAHASSTPLSLPVGAAIGLSATDAGVTIAGSITAAGDLFIQSRTDTASEARAAAETILPLGTASVALTLLNANTATVVAPSAVLQAGGDLTVSSDAVSRDATLSRSAAGSGGSLGLSLALADIATSTTTTLNGTATAGDDLSVAAVQRKQPVPGDPADVAPGFVDGVAAVAGSPASSGGLLGTLLNLLLAPINVLAGPVQQFLRDQATAAVGTLSSVLPTVDVAAAASLLFEHNAATAAVGDAVVRAGGDLTVNARAESRPAAIAGANLSHGQGGSLLGLLPSQVAAAAAVAFADHSNEAKAFVDGGTAIDAGGSLVVRSEALNDQRSDFGDALSAPLGLKPDWATDDGVVPIAVGEVVEVKPGHVAGGEIGSWYRRVGTPPAGPVDLGAEDFTGPGWQGLGAGGWRGRAGDTIDNLTAQLAGPPGASGRTVDTWTQATSAGSTAGVAGTLTLLHLDQASHAWIAPGANVNQAPEYRTGDQGVSVEAVSVNSAVSLGGNGQVAGGQRFVIDPERPGTGTPAGTGGNAVGAAALLLSFRSDTRSTIHDDALVFADRLVVSADSTTIGLSSVASGGRAEPIGFVGSFALTAVDNATRATIEPRARVVVGDASADETGASAVVRAADRTEILTATGGVTAASNVGVGASLTVSRVIRDTRAIVGHPEGEAETADRPVTATGSLLVDARNRGFVGSLSLAAAEVVRESDPDGEYEQVDPEYGGHPVPTQANGDREESGGLFGVGLSADVSLNEVADTAVALIRGVTVDAGGATVSAGNDTMIASAAGSSAIVTADVLSLGLAASLGRNLLSGSTRAAVEEAVLILEGDLAVDAESAGYVVSSASSGSTARAVAGVAVAGQVSLNEVTAGTEAAVLASDVTAADVAVTATDSSGIFANGGAKAFGGALGIGASISLNTVPALGDTQSVRAAVEDSDLTATGTVSVVAAAAQQIVAIGTAAGASKAGMAGALTLSINVNTPVTEAVIRGGRTADGIDAGGDVIVSARNDSFIRSVAGATGTTGGILGFGLSFALDVIAAETRASVESATLDSAGTLRLDSTSAATIDVAAFGGGEAAGGPGLAAIGAGVGIAINDIPNDVSATIVASRVTARGSSLTASSRSVVAAAATGAGGAVADSQVVAGVSLAAAGGAVVNLITDDVEAAVRSSTLTVDGPVALTAEDASTITADTGGFARASAAGPLAVALSVGASLAVNVIANAVAAVIDASSLTGNGPVDLVARESAAIQTLSAAGSAAAATGQESGVGFAGAGAISLNFIHNAVDAAITGGSTVRTTGGGAVSLRAVDSSSVLADAGALGVGLAGGTDTGVAVGIGASVAVNTITNAVGATIDTTVDASGGITLDAASAASIRAVTVGQSGAAATGGLAGIAVGVAGGIAVNIIANDVDAAIRDTAVSSGGLVTVLATDTASITAATGAGALASMGDAAAGLAAGLGVSVAVNAIIGGPRAAVEGATVTAAGGLAMTASADSVIRSLTTAGAEVAADGNLAGIGLAGAGAIAVNTILGTTEALITAGSLVSTAPGGSVALAARDTSTIVAEAGAASRATASGGLGNASAGVGVSVAVNTVANTVRAVIDTTVHAGGDVSLGATGSARISAVTSGYGTGESDGLVAGVSFAGAGAVALNTIVQVVDASIRNTEVTAAGTMTVGATGGSQLTAATGTGAVADSTASGVGIAAAVGASVAINSIVVSVDATIDNARIVAGSLHVDAAAASTITAVTTAGVAAASDGDVLGLALGGAGAIAVNSILTSVDALITNGGDVATSAGDVGLTATDRSTIVANAGAVSEADAGGGLAPSGAVGASVAVNTVAGAVGAAVDGATVHAAGHLTMLALADAHITAITVARSDAVADGAIFGVAVAGSGAVAVNTIVGTVDAAVRGGSMATAAGDVSLDAIDSSHVRAITGAGADATTTGLGFGPVGASGAAGASVAVNSIGSRVTAIVTDSRVNAAGKVEVNAGAASTIDALTTAGAAASTGGNVLGIAVAGAGAIAVNTIVGLVSALLTGDAIVSSGAGQSVEVTAHDGSIVTANSGAASDSEASGGVANSLSVGLSLAVNSVVSAVTAAVDDAAVDAGGDLLVDASSHATVLAVTIGYAGAGNEETGPGVTIPTVTLLEEDLDGLAAAGAGAVSVNTIASLVDASIRHAQDVTSGGRIDVKAADCVEITAATGAGADSESTAAGVGVAAGIGASAAANQAVSLVRATVDQADIQAAQAVAVDALGHATITTVTTAGASSATDGGALGLSLALAGAISLNTIVAKVDALILGGATVTTAASFCLTAHDRSRITANAGAVSLSAASGEIEGGTAAVGASVAVNTIVGLVSARVDGSTVQAGGSLHVDARSDGTILAVTIGRSDAAGAGEFAGIAVAAGGAVAVNSIVGVVDASVRNARARADGAVCIHAEDTSRITAATGAGADAASESLGIGVGAAVGASVAINSILAGVWASLINADVESAGGVTVKADGASTITSVSTAGAETAADGDVRGLSLVAAGAVSINSIVASVNALVTAGSRVLPGLGFGVTVFAHDATTITANAGAVADSRAEGGASESATAFGASVAVNTIGSLVSAAVDGSTIVSSGDVTIDARSDAHILAVTVGDADSSSSATILGLSIVGAGGIAVNTIVGAVEASIRNGSTVTSTAGGVTVRSTDHAEIEAATGALATATSAAEDIAEAAGVGLSLAINSVASRAAATIAGSAVTAAGPVDVSAKSNSDVLAITLAGAEGGAASFLAGLSLTAAGAVTVNTVVGSVDARVLDGAAVTSGADVRVVADDCSRIRTVSGAGALDGTAALGDGVALAAAASLAVNTVLTSVGASVDSSTVAAAGAVCVDADARARITAATAAGTAAGALAGVAGLSAAASGAVAVNTVLTVVDATISGGSTVTSGPRQDVVVTADDNTILAALAGAGSAAAALALEEAAALAVGASIAVNTAGGSVHAAIDGSTVHAGKDARVDAQSLAVIGTVTVGFSVAAGAGLVDGVGIAGAGAISINTIGLPVGLALLAPLPDSDPLSDVLPAGFPTAAIIPAGIPADDPSRTPLTLADIVPAGFDVVDSLRNGLAVEATIRNGSVVTADGNVRVHALDQSAITAATGAGAVGAAIGLGVAASTAVGLSISANQVFSTVRATVNGSTVAADAEASVVAEARAGILAATMSGSLAEAGGVLFGLSLGAAGAASINTVVTTVDARISGGSVVTSGPGHDVLVCADDLSGIVADAGAASAAGAIAIVGPAAIGLGASVAINTVGGSVTAAVDDATVHAGRDLRVDAGSTAVILALTVGRAHATAASVIAGIGVGAAGAIAINTIGVPDRLALPETLPVETSLPTLSPDDVLPGGLSVGQLLRDGISVEATIRGGSRVTSGRDVVVKADDGAVITAASGAGATGDGAAGLIGVGAAVGVSLAVNQISSHVDASIDGSVVSSAGEVALEAKATSIVIAATVAGAAAGAGGVFAGVTLAGGGALSFNTIGGTVDAGIRGGAEVTTGIGRHVRLDAHDDSNITAVGGAVAGAVSAGAVGLAGAGGVSVALNSIGNRVAAEVDGATVTSGGDVRLNACSTAEIVALSAGLSGASANGLAGLALGAAGSISLNSIAGAVDSSIRESDPLQPTSVISRGAVRLYARDDSGITSTAVAGSLNEAGGLVGVAASLGAGVGVNLIVSHAGVTIDGARVDARGDVVLDARSLARITGLSLSGAVGVSVGGIGGIALNGAGAIVFNSVASEVDARIVDGANVTADGAVRLAAHDDATILGNAGAIAAALATGLVSAGFSLGFSVALNSITHHAGAIIDAATVDAAAGIQLAADTDATITAVTVGLAGGAAPGGIAGIGLAGAGSISINTIGGGVEAAVRNTDGVTTRGDLSLSAADTSEVKAAGGAGAVALSAGLLGASVTVGASVALNDIGNTVRAAVEGGSEVTAAGGVSVHAEGRSDISSFTVSGVAAAAGGFVGVAVAGSGAGSINKIANEVTATVAGGSVISALGGDVSVSALDASTIVANAGAIAAAGSAGVVAVAGAAGASIVLNEIGNTTEATVDGSTVVASGAVAIAADSTASVAGVALGAAAAFSLGAGAAVGAGGGVSRNVIHNTTRAAIVAGGRVTAAGDVTVAATETATITTGAGGASAAIGVGSIAIGLVLAENDIRDTVAATVAGAVATSTAGTVRVAASSTSRSTNVAVAAAVAEGLAGLTGGKGRGVNHTANTVTASVSGRSDVRGAAGIAVTAADDAAGQATIGSLAVSAALIGASMGMSTTETDISDTVTATVDDSDLTSSAGNITVAATTTTSGSATSLATAGAVIGVAIAGADSTASDHTRTVASVAEGARLSAIAGSVGVIAGSTRQARAVTPGGAGGFVSVNRLDSSATMGGTTEATLGDRVVVDARDLDVRATGAAAAGSSTTAGSLGLFASTKVSATTTVDPTIKATVGRDVRATLSRDVRVNALSTRAEGNAVAQGGGVGGAGVYVPAATVTLTPGVATLVDRGSVITAGGSVVIDARALSLPADDLDDEIEAVDTADDAITFDQHGLTTGDSVVYELGSGTGIGVPGGTLTDGREYQVVVLGRDTIRLGSTFAATATNTADPFDTQAGIDPDRDVIRFAAPHRFVTGDAVRLDPQGFDLPAGLNARTMYFVRVIDATTIKLATSSAAASEASLTIGAPAVDGDADTIAYPAGTAEAERFQDGDAVTYRGPGGVEFDGFAVDLVVDPEGLVVRDGDLPTRDPGLNTIYFAEPHGLSTGDKVVYRTDGEPGDGVAGLIDGQAYYVIRLSDREIQLAASRDGAVVSPDPIELGPAPDSSTSRHRLERAAIGGLVDGETYFVVNATATHFQLSGTPGGSPIDLDGSEVSGTHRIGREHGIDLDAGEGVMELHLDLTGEGARGDELLGPGGVSLRANTPALGTGISRAIARGGSGGVFDLNAPTATLTATSSVGVTVDGATIDAAGDVTLAAVTDERTRAEADIKGGGLVQIGKAFASNTDRPTTEVTVTGASRIRSQGKLALSTITAVDASVDAHAVGVKGFGSTRGDASVTVVANTTTQVDGGSDVAGRDVAIIAEVPSIEGNANSVAKTFAFGGSANATSTSNVTSNATVNILGNGTTVAGTESEDIRATQGVVEADSTAEALNVSPTFWLGEPVEIETVTEVSTVTDEED